MGGAEQSRRPTSSAGLGTPVALEPGTYASAAIDVPVYAQRFGEAFGSLARGTHVVVVDAERGWYLVQFTDVHTSESIFGWIHQTSDVSGEPEDGAGASGASSGASVASTLNALPIPECDLERPQTLGILPQYLQFECAMAAREPIEFNGWIVSVSPATAAYRGEPAWLAEAPKFAVVGALGPAITPGGAIGVHLPPGTAVEGLVSDPDGDPAVPVLIRGHFDDEAASSCAREPMVAGYPDLAADLDELWCRQQFVIDTVSAVTDD